MTLKTDYTGALSTSITNATTAGGAFVVANKPVILNSLLLAASNGQKTFITFIETSYLPEALKLKGDLLNAYLNGIKAGLLAEGISSALPTIEVAVSLDTSVVNVNKIKFSFTFA